MSAIFQRPLCDMGKAYDFSFRPRLGDPETGSGGPCDDHPHRVDLYSATADAGSVAAEWQPFSLCPEHEEQLHRFDARFAAIGSASRFRSPPSSRVPDAKGRGG
ncbi:MAG: hypothetical protein ACRECT_03140 [Thermoplasmata archaeon]